MIIDVLGSGLAVLKLLENVCHDVHIVRLLMIRYSRRALRLVPKVFIATPVPPIP